MEILQLRYFFESAKFESFAKTAQKYMVPITSVSASVKRLENELGCTLFDRQANGILINDNGRKLLKSMYVIFGELDDITEILSDKDADTREIKMLVCAMRGQITDYIIEYKTKHPHISFKTVFDFDEINVDDYDIIIDDKPQEYKDYENFELCSNRIMLKAASDSPLCNRRITLKQLRNQSFLSMGEQSSMHQILINACKRSGFSPNIVVQTNDTQCYKKCLESGIGIGLGRDNPREYNNNVQFLNVTDFDARQTVYAFYKKQHAYGNVEH
ncbi:MAG: LysR family transcriptional regulator, partial [Clostridia bacterium]|nr:LysR family transcriptional regulator [Clostridia bacterium]